MAEADKVLMTVAIPGPKPGIVQAAKAMGVRREALDQGFGVVPVDPERHLYAVQVCASAVPQAASDDESYRGPFSNPRIAPFGPSGE